MSAPAPKVESSGDLIIITVTGARRLLENPLGSELDRHTEGLEKSHILLDFTRVQHLGSLELGALIGLHKRQAAAGGRLTLFNLSPQVYEVFSVTRLDTLLQICRQAT